jgi:hypothetical protein
VIKKQLLLVLATTIVALVTACGGGGGGSVAPGSSAASGSPTSPPTSSPGATAGPTMKVALTVTIPGKKTSSRARGPQYIAPNSGSMTLTLLTVNGSAVQSAAQGPFNLVPGGTNPNCVAGTNTTCTFTISAPVGTDFFLADTYSTTNGTGQPLGSGSVLLSVMQNATNFAHLSLTGPVNTVQVVSATTTLYNGNPIPAPSSSDEAIARGAGAQAQAVHQARIAALSRSKASAATRKPAVLSSPLPAPAVALTSSISVIALDAAGNQIINPTTFDIPITLTLSLNGAPAGSVTLAVQYAGLTGEPSSSASTSSDGGTVGVFAPSDTVTLTLTGTSALTSTFAPTIAASYTPQGGTLQTSSALTYSVFMPLPAAELAASASHVDPFTAGVAANVTDAYLNIGTAPTSGQIEAQFYPSNLTYNGTAAGTDPSWTCTNYGYYVDCLSNAVVPANGSLPLVFNVTPTGPTPAYNELDVFGGNAVNAISDVYVVDQITIQPLPSAILNIAETTNALTDGNFAQGAAGNFLITVSNTGTLATTSQISLVDTLPANMTGTGTGAGWTCSGTATITCTTNAVLAASAAAPVITVNATSTTQGTYTNALTATSTNAVTGTLSPGFSVYGPITLTPLAPSAPDHLQLFIGAPNGTLQAQAPYYTGTLTATILNGAFGSPPCSNYLYIPTPSLSGPTANFSVVPLQVTGFIYNAGTPGTYCTISVNDVNGRSETIPITVTSVTLNGQ